MRTNRLYGRIENRRNQEASWEQAWREKSWFNKETSKKVKDILSWNICSSLDLNKQLKKLSSTEECFDLLKENRNISPDVYTLNTVMSKASDLKEAYRVLRDELFINVDPDNISLDILLSRAESFADSLLIRKTIPVSWTKRTADILFNIYLKDGKQEEAQKLIDKWTFWKRKEYTQLKFDFIFHRDDPGLVNRIIKLLQSKIKVKMKQDIVVSMLYILDEERAKLLWLERNKKIEEQLLKNNFSIVAPHSQQYSPYAKNPYFWEEWARPISNEAADMASVSRKEQFR